MACSKDNASTAQETKKPLAVSCNDTTGLSEADIKTRTTLKYVEVSTVAGKDCSNCSLFVTGSPCGTCKVMKGPIAAKGNCSAWAKKV